MRQITDTGRIITTQPRDVEAPHLNQEIMHRITGLIALGATSLNILICLRYLLILLDANLANPFADLIYNTTAPFLAVFHGLTRSPALINVATELNTLIAITAYSLLAWTLNQLIRIMFGGTK